MFLWSAECTTVHDHLFHCNQQLPLIQFVYQQPHVCRENAWQQRPVMVASLASLAWGLLKGCNPCKAENSYNVIQNVADEEKLRCFLLCRQFEYHEYSRVLPHALLHQTKKPWNQTPRTFLSTKLIHRGFIHTRDHHKNKKRKTMQWNLKSLSTDKLFCNEIVHQATLV